MEITSKICSRCKVVKLAEAFGKQVTVLSGLRSDCKECRKKLYYENHEKSKEDKRKDYEKHKETRLESCKEYYLKNSKAIKKRSNNWYYENKEKASKRNREYRASEPIKARRRAQHKVLMKTSPVYVLEHRLRGRIRRVLKDIGMKKENHFIDLLGCDLKTLKEHIESQFTEGMSWDGIFNQLIVVDHYVPCAVFDLEKPEEQFQCFNYKNLRPLWQGENCSKAAEDKRLKQFKLAVLRDMDYFLS